MNIEWLLDLCFLVDIVEKLNQLNISIQAKDNLITNSFNNNMNALLLLFESQLKSNNDQHIPLLNKLKIQNTPITLNMQNRYIRKLIDAFESRFTNLDKYEKIMFEIYSSHFHTNVKSAPVAQYIFKWNSY